MTNSKEMLAKQLQELQSQMALEEEKESQPHAIVKVTVNNNAPINIDRNKNMGFTHNDEMYGTITLAKFVGIENHGLETVLETPTGVKLSAETFASIQQNLNVTCFAQVPLRSFGSSKVNGSKMLSIRIEKPLILNTIQALGKNEMGDNASVFTDPDNNLVYLTQEEVAAGVDPKLTPKMTLLVTVLFEDTDIEERFNPQQSVFTLDIKSEEDLLAQLVSDSSFNSAKDASGLAQWRANRPIDSMKDLEESVANELANQALNIPNKEEVKA